MSKRKYYLCIDTETANSLDFPLVYDIGYAVTDRNGKIYESAHYVIYDIYCLEKSLMDTCYYHDKRALYEKNLSTHKSKLVNFSTARAAILDACKRYSISTVMAYNMDFDRRALNTTIRYITKSRNRYFFPYGITYSCIWNMACQSILSQTRYLKLANAQNWISPSGFIRTTAEYAYKYIIKDNDYCEQHTGLEDTLIEVEIFAKCMAQHKKLNKDINRACFRIPTKKWKRISSLL